MADGAGLRQHGAMEEALLRQARRYAALGEPVRLALIRQLLLTDASPGELGATFGLATNVLAHHLKVLQAAGLVRRVRSEGDARRAYVQLRLNDPHVMALIDPGVDPTPVPTGLPPDARPQRVMFVCTHNSARSQLAAAAWQNVSGMPVASAGTQPAPRVHPRAVAVGRRHGLRIDGARTARFADAYAAGDLVVSVCDNAHEALTSPPGGLPTPVAPTMHWAVPDPAHPDTDDAFEAAYTEITGRVERLALALASAGTQEP